MKILCFVACMSLAGVLTANEARRDDENVSVMSKVVEGLNELKSSKCKSDLNRTVNAFYDRKPWAVASKKETSMRPFRSAIYSYLDILSRRS